MFRAFCHARKGHRRAARFVAVACFCLLLFCFSACSNDGTKPGDPTQNSTSETAFESDVSPETAGVSDTEPSAETNNPGSESETASDGGSATDAVSDTEQPTGTVPPGSETEPTTDSTPVTDVVSDTVPSDSETESAPETEVDTFGDIEEILAAYHDPDGRTLSCAHRAIVSLDTRIPENSLAAVRACIEAGVDILEIDVKRTKDGVYVLCHDAGINRCTTYTGSKTVPEMMYAEMRRYDLREYTGLEREIYKDDAGKTEHIPKFSDVLALVKDECMINFDQFTNLWDYRMELYALVKDAGCLPNVIFKGWHSVDQLKQWQAEIREAYGEDAVMPLYSIMYSSDDPADHISVIRRYAEAGVANCVEATFSSFDSCMADGAYMAKVRTHMRTFADILTDSLGGNGYCAGMHENVLGWIGAEMCGYNIIQTNNAADCAAYIRRKYGPRDTSVSENIPALSLGGFDTPLTDPRLTLHDGALTVTGDVTLSFDRLDFGTDTAGEVILCLSTTHSDGRVTISTATDPQTALASTELSVFCESLTAISLPLSSIPTGVQNLRMTFEGLSEGQTVRLAYFLVSAKGLGDVVEYAPIFLLSEEGHTPALPTTVVGLTDRGYHVATNVQWAEIPASCYQTAPTIFTVPGTADGKAVSARVEIVPFDPADVLVWYQAGQGMELDESGHVLRWIDRVHGIEAVATGAASRPAFTDGQLVFDGKDDFLTFDSAILGRRELTVILGSQNSQSTKEYNSEFHFNNGPRHALLMFPETGGWGSVWFSTFTDAVSCRFGTGNDGNRGFVYTNVKLDKWTVSAAVKNHMNEDLYLDGTCVYRRAEDTGNQYCTPGMGTSIANTASYAYIGLGIQSSARYFYRGTASDILLFSKALSDEDIARVSAYLRGLHDGTLEMVDRSDEILAD